MNRAAQKILPPGPARRSPFFGDLATRLLLLLGLVCFGLLFSSARAEITIGPYDPSATIHAGTKPLDQRVVRMVGARNGSATGLVILRESGRSAGQIDVRLNFLRHTLYPQVDLAREVQILYGSREQDFGPSRNRPNVREFPYFDALVREPLRSGDPVLPIYLHLPISATMEPGHYRGELVVRHARGRETLEVFLTLTTFTVPAPANRLGWVDMLQSPDSIAYRYDVPLYSANHLSLLEPSLQKLANLGNRVMHVTAIAQTNFGNDEAMIPIDHRRIDFSGFEAYFAAYRRIVGNPSLVVLYVDEQGHNRAPLWTPTGGRRDGRTAPIEAAYDEAHRAQWQALIDGLHQRLTTAGVDPSALMLGWIGDDRNYDARVAYWKEISPSTRWVQFTHARGDPTAGREETLMVGSMPVGYRILPYAPRNAPVREGGWNLPLIQATSMRFYNNQSSPVPYFRFLGPVSVQEESRERVYRGFARLGLDFWSVPTPTEGQRSLLKRFSHWHNLQRFTAPSITVPGPEGAIPTARYLNLWEGLQENEAALLIEKTLAERSDHIPADLRREAQDVLDKWREARGVDKFRSDAGNHNWDHDDPEIPADWPERLQALYLMAARFQ